MALVLMWSIARLIMDQPTQFVPAPVLNGSQGIHPSTAPAAADPVRAKFTAADPVHLVVRDGKGKLVFTGDLHAGDVVRRHVVPPVKVSSTDGGAITAVIDGRDQGTLGQSGKASRSTFLAR
jgi:hypothetical protein